MVFCRLKLIFISVFLFGSFVSKAQFLDTVFSLNPVEISISKEEFLVGSKIESLDSMKLEANKDGSLTDIINNYFPIYIKENAGGLATIKFRGTSADHTSIMFNGININSLTLGHSNISHVPSFLFDEVKIQYGSSSSLYGTDAIGGSIHLNNKTRWNQGFNLGLEGGFASFNSYFKGIQLGYSNNGISYKIKAYHLDNENSFPFTNTAVKDFEKKEFIQDTSKNSALLNYGLLQELDFKLGNHLFSYIKYWYDFDWYEAQPNMSANYYGGDFVEILNKHSRAIAGLKYYKGNHKIISEFGYVEDYQLYNKNEEQIISTKTFLGKLNYFNSKLWDGRFNFGVNYNYILPEVYAYNGNINEKRIDVFTSYKKQFSPKLSAIINLRETIVINYRNRFTPTFGLNYTFFDDTDQDWKIKLSYSSSYKIPTFNQRFWYPNGNPNILPENGNNFEFNSDYHYKEKGVEYDFGLSTYYMQVDNWIQWVNLDIWRPINLKKVNNVGFELKLRSRFKISNIFFTTSLSYGYTRAVEVKSYNGKKINKGKQLIYTPKHLGKIFCGLVYKNWNFHSIISYTGSRYTESYKQLDGYLLFNMRVGKTIKAGSHLFNINFKVQNVFNVQYQNWEYYAMPGRNYAINLKYYINKFKRIKNEND